MLKDMKTECMNTTQEHEKGTTLLCYSPWRANIALCYTITRRGKWMASKHCSLSRIARRGEQTTRGGTSCKFERCGGKPTLYATVPILSDI